MGDAGLAGAGGSACLAAREWVVGEVLAWLEQVGRTRLCHV
jgi:hypothetical protein